MKIVRPSLLGVPTQLWEPIKMPPQGGNGINHPRPHIPLLSDSGQKRSLPMPAFQIRFAGESRHSICASRAQRRCIMAVSAEVLPRVLRRATYVELKLADIEKLFGRR